MSFIDFLIPIATAAAPAGTGGPAAPGTGAAPPQLLHQLMSLMPIILIVIFFFFIMSSSKRKQDRQRRELLESLKRGDRIRMIGGEFGTVVEIKDGKVQVKVDETSNAKIWYAKDAVQAVEKETEASK